MSHPSIFWILHYADRVDASDLWWALRDIGELGDPAIVPQLKPLIHENGPTGKGHRLIGLDAAVALDGAAARDIILPMLRVGRTEEEGFYLAEELANTIGKLATQGVDCTVAVEPLLLFLADDNRVENLRSAARRALIKIGAPAVPFLIELLNPQEDYELQSRVVEILGEIGDRRAEAAIEASLAWLAPRYQITVLQNLARVGGAKTEKLLLSYLQSSDTEKKRDALRGLVRLKELRDPRLFELLKQALQDESLGLWMRDSIVTILGQLGHPDGYSLIAPFATADYEYSLRQAAFEALGHIGNHQAFDLIKAGLQDPRRDIEQTAIAALGNLGDPRGAIAIVENVFERQRGCLYEEEKDALKKIGLSAVPQLLQQLKSADSPLLSVMAMECLGEIAQSSEIGSEIGRILQPEIDMLLALFKDYELKLSDLHRGAVAIATALVRTGDERAIDGLLKVLSKAPLSISRALELLEVNQANRRIIEPLLKQLKSSHISDLFIRIFVKFDAKEAIPTLIEHCVRLRLPGQWKCGYAMVREGEWEERTQGGVLPERTGWQVSPNCHQVLEALTQLSDQDGLSLIFDVWQTPEHPSRAAAGRVMKFLGHLAYPKLLDYLDHDDEVLAIEAIQALGHMGLPRAVPELIGCLDDARTSVRLAAIESLRWIGDPAAAPAVEQQLSDPNPDVRDMSRRALRRFSIDQRAHLERDMDYTPVD
ncbi:MAG: HEAT repeat domain-containing protein [Elainellaceae cyanobacterium]